MLSVVPVLIPQWSFQQLYNLFMRMPSDELKEEYQAAMACSDCFSVFRPLS